MSSDNVHTPTEDDYSPLNITLHFLSGQPQEIAVTAETTFGDVFREYGMYLCLDSTLMASELVVSQFVAVCGNEGHFLAYVSEVYPDVDLEYGWFVWETTGWNWRAEVKTEGYDRSSKLHALTRVHMPRATHVMLEWFKALEHVTAPQALKHHIEYSPVLKNLHAPVVRDIHLWDCHSLKHLSLPTATKVHLIYCEGLESLDTPIATTLKLYGLKKLTHMSAPAAAKVNVCYCHALLRFDSPAAKEIIMENCRQLLHVNAPAAEKVDIANCPGLHHVPL